MRHPDIGLVLATGGTAMVKAAYSSGTPAIGVGSGNAPTLVCADADLDAADVVVGGSNTVRLPMIDLWSERGPP